MLQYLTSGVWKGYPICNFGTFAEKDKLQKLTRFELSMRPNMLNKITGSEMLLLGQVKLIDNLPSSPI